MNREIRCVGPSVLNNARESVAPHRAIELWQRVGKLNSRLDSTRLYI